MLSYQHAYHAGNFADLHKHAVLAALLVRLTQKARPITYLESHTGRGLYDLSAPEAEKTGEAAEGIARIVPEGAYAEALQAVRKRYGETTYPGSPLIAQTLLRAQDRLVLCELHPTEHAALSRALSGNAAIHRRDGHEGLRALTPPTPRRGLALIDPSYEVKDEYATAAETALAVNRRWSEGVVMLWYPLLPAGRHLDLLGMLSPAKPLVSEAHLVTPPERGMPGSGLTLLGAPWGTEGLIAEALRPLSPVLETPSATPR
ncbi:MAG: 23S rRNA (adenine(2030)-N(6))-methyltransferase RlmJ [Pseudomonadota bacterium]